MVYPNRPISPYDRESFVREPDWLIRQRELRDKCMPLARFHEAWSKWESPMPPSPAPLSPAPPRPVGLENAERMHEMLRPPIDFRR